MIEKSTIKGMVLAIATYKPKTGQEEALLKIVQSHLPALRELGLVTDKPGYMAKSSDGTIIEIFEWVSTEAVHAAHQHPVVSGIWDQMTVVADFLPFNSLPESDKVFPGFELIN